MYTWLLLASRLGSNDCVELNEKEMSWVAFVILLREEKKYNPSLQIDFYGDLTPRVTRADFDKQITRAFGLHASRRLSPWF